MFPVVNGMDLPFEVFMFWVEHYLGALVQPLTLIVSGRYGFFELKTFLAQ
jgi:hypothetical protein